MHPKQQRLDVQIGELPEMDDELFIDDRVRRQGTVLDAGDDGLDAEPFV